MMKRFLICVLIVMLLCSGSYVVFATDYPESLYFDDTAQIFFAQVVEYRSANDTHYVKVKPVKIIKGDVVPGEELVYENARPFGHFTVKTGKAYLLTLTRPTDSPYLFRCDGYDTRSLDVIDMKERQGGIERFERHLANGKYEEAEAQRRQRCGLSPQPTQIEGELPPLHTLTDDYMAIFNALVLAAGILLASILVVFVYGVKKRKP